MSRNNIASNNLYLFLELSEKLLGEVTETKATLSKREADFFLPTAKSLSGAISRVNLTNRSLEMIHREQIGKLSPRSLPAENKKANPEIGLID